MVPRQEPSFSAGRTLQQAGTAAFPGFSLRVLARTASTQDIVGTAGRAGAAEGYCCMADEQTAGRGRLGRRWAAPAGTALLASILLRPSATSMGGITLAAGLATCDAVLRVSGVEARLRWPNDVMVDGGKLAGILAEAQPAATGGPGAAVVLGVGVNLAVDGFPRGVRGASLHRLVPRPPGREPLLAAILTALSRRLKELDRGGIPALREPWRRRAHGLGAVVSAQGPAGSVVGTAIDLSDDGALVVLTPTGQVPIVSGKVVWAGET